MALGLTYIIRIRQPKTPAVTTVRGKLEAALLISQLNLPSGKPALIEFMDLECGPCRSSYPKIKAILAANPSAIYKAVNFPLSMHQYAFGAAVAVEIARNGGQHDQVFEDLFGGNVGLDPKSLNAYLGKHHLAATVGQAESADAKKAVNSQIELGKHLKINATPTIMVISRDGTLTEVQGFDAIGPLLK